jgi:hypothetical protein
MPHSPFPFFVELFKNVIGLLFDLFFSNLSQLLFQGINPFLSIADLVVNFSKNAQEIFDRFPVILHGLVNKSQGFRS